MHLKSMKVEIDPKTLSFELVRKLVDEFLTHNPKEGKKFWDVMVALRGPDQGFGSGPAKIDGSTPTEENARISRKKLTSTIIRGRMFPGTVHCSAAQIDANPDAIIQLPAKAGWDHFDKHVFKAATVLGIKYEIEGEPKPILAEGGEWVLMEDHPTYHMTFVVGPLTFDPQEIVGQSLNILSPAGHTMIITSSGFKAYIQESKSEFAKSSRWLVTAHDGPGMIYVKPMQQVQVVAPPPPSTKVADLPANMWSMPTEDTHPEYQVIPSELFKDLKALAAKREAKGTPGGPWFDTAHHLILVKGDHSGTYTMYGEEGWVPPLKFKSSGMIASIPNGKQVTKG